MIRNDRNFGIMVTLSYVVNEQRDVILPRYILHIHILYVNTLIILKGPVEDLD